MTEPCLEMVRFRLSDGADADAFRAAAPAVTAWAARQPGFQYRTLIEETDGGWIDMVWWRSAGDAKAAGAKFMADLGATPFVAMIDAGSVEMGHHKVAHMSGAA